MTEKIIPTAPESSEKIPSSEWARHIRSTLLASFLLFLPANAKTLELPPQADWKTGVKELIETALKKKNEYGALYIQSENLSRWAEITKGSSDTLLQRPSDGVLAVLEHAQAVIKQSGNTAFQVTVCDAHTHPVNEAGKVHILIPSLDDIRYHILFSKKLHQYLASISGIDARLVSLVVEPHGAWYYETTSGAELKPDELNKGKLLELMSKYSREFRQGKPEATQSYIELKRALSERGIKMRFLTHEEILAEPACTGVDYDPSKTTSK